MRAAMAYLTPVLHVDTHAIIRNWQRLQALHPLGAVAAVVKANAYGLGVAQVSAALRGAGCHTFFVATLDEAITLRQTLPDSAIYVFQGVLEGEHDAYHTYRLHAVINTLEQAQQWNTIRATYPDMLPAAIHVDTAMQRLGLTIGEVEQRATLLHSLHANLLMTHYACASDLKSPINQHQCDTMQHAVALLPHLTTSYANSAAHFLPPSYHGTLTRPGCALYGINPCDTPDTMMEPVASLSAPILQIRTIEQAGTLGYCATVPVKAGMKTATIGIGYADGIFRHSSNQLYGYIGDIRVPLLGRVTMDMLCFDVSQVPDATLEAETCISLMDHRQTVDDLARIYHTIGYEVLTSLGARITRRYV